MYIPKKRNREKKKKYDQYHLFFMCLRCTIDTLNAIIKSFFHCSIWKKEKHGIYNLYSKITEHLPSIVWCGIWPLCVSVPEFNKDLLVSVWKTLQLQRNVAIASQWLFVSAVQQVQCVTMLACDWYVKLSFFFLLSNTDTMPTSILKDHHSTCSWCLT